MAINTQELKGRWNDLKGQVKQKWGQLTDDDLQWGSGNIDQIVGRIQERTGERREAIEHYLGGLTAQGASAVSQAAQSVGNYASHASERLREHYDQFSDQARERYEQAYDVVQHNPVQWVGIAFGAGVLVGLLLAPAVRSR